MENQVKNSNLNKAKKEKNDEFYTQYYDIESEMNAYLEYDVNTFRGKTVLLPCDDPEWSNFTKYFAQNFTRLGLKKLISTGYAIGGRGKIFTVDVDINGDGVIDIDDLKWEYLEGDGDFRSDEVKQLRSEADIIVTNPPFSLFREFFDWVMEGNLKFAVIANKNCVAYKNVFNYIKNNEIWSGKTKWAGGMFFETIKDEDVDKIIDGKNVKNVSSIWISNIEHGRRHQPMQLMTMVDNKKYNKKVSKTDDMYKHYANYEAIEVSFTDAIPSDYKGVMGVPISFLDKYNPEQFAIIGITKSWDFSDEIMHFRKDMKNRDGGIIVGSNGEITIKYTRILIKHKNI